MKRASFIVLSCLVVVCFTSTAYSDGVYVGGNVGLAMVNDSNMTIPGLAGEVGMPVGVEVELKMGVALGGVVGYDLGKARIEAEIAYQKSDLDKLSMSAGGIGVSIDISGDMTSLALLGNVYYDFHNESAFTPYISGGVGFAKVSTNDLAIEGESGSEDEDDTVFAYQVGLGLGYAATEKVTIEAKYRYFATADLDFEEGVEAEFGGHHILVGVRISF